MSTYCVSKAKLLIQCENIDLFRKGDFFRQPSVDLPEVQLKGLLDVCQQSIQGRGFDAQKPFEKIQIADAFHFAYLCHFSVVQQNFASGGNHIIELACSHAIMETKISIFVHPIKKNLCILLKKIHLAKKYLYFNFHNYSSSHVLSMPLISVKAWSKGAPILFFSIVKQCRLLNINICFICYEPIKNTPCFIVSLETSFEEDKQEIKRWFERRSEGRIIFYVCVFCRYT